MFGTVLYSGKITDFQSTGIFVSTLKTELSLSVVFFSSEVEHSLPPVRISVDNTAQGIQYWKVSQNTHSERTPIWQASSYSMRHLVVTQHSAERLDVEEQHLDAEEQRSDVEED